MKEAWVPRSETDIQSHIKAGVVAETHYLDLKREVEATQGGGKDLARNLAQFALDGGALLIGVAEDKVKRTWELSPVSLEGLPERVEQIAQSVIDPPLFVSITEIPASEPGTGYLHIGVPPSASAPHMVDGTYFGRGDRTRIRMSNSEVVRLHAAQADRADLGHRLLDEEMDRDPVLGHRREHGHLYFVAHPLSASRHVARPLVRGDVTRIRELLTASEAAVPAGLRQQPPTPETATEVSTRARGTARCSPTLVNGRHWDPGADSARSEKWMVDFEFREDGSIRGLVGRGTFVQDESNYATRFVRDDLALGYVFRCLEWSRRVSEEVGYRGEWVLAMALVGFRGHRSVAFLNGWAESGAQYSEDDYREVTTATTLELTRDPCRVAARLIEPLLHGLGSWDTYRGFVGSTGDR